MEEFFFQIDNMVVKYLKFYVKDKGGDIQKKKKAELVTDLKRLVRTDEFITMIRIEEEETLVPEANVKSCRVRELPLKQCIHFSHYIIPNLHILLGIGNKLVDSFFSWINDRVEPKSNDYIEALKVSIISEQSVDLAEDELVSIKRVISLLTEELIDLNKVKNPIEDKVVRMNYLKT